VQVRTLLVSTIGLLCLTVLEWRVVDLIQAPNRVAEEDATAGVLAGRPQWRNYQSRILAPGLVAAATTVTGLSFARASQLVAAGLLLLVNATCLALFRGDGRFAAWTYTIVYAGFFVALQDREWLFLWDYVDLFVFLLFAWAVVTRASSWIVVALFFCELLNRETALLIAVWIVLDAVNIERRSARVVWRGVGTGAALGGLAVLWLRFIRGYLFRGQSLPLGPGYRTVFGALWMLPHNYHAIITARSRLDTGVGIVAVAATAVLLHRAWRVLDRQAWKVATLLSMSVASIAMFGLVTETRVWMCLSPFWLWLAHAAYGSRPARDARHPYPEKPAHVHGQD
jgi:hypothetical protein